MPPEQEFDDKKLVPNLAIKAASEAFRNENDWLEEFEQYVSNFDTDDTSRMEF